MKLLLFFALIVIGAGAVAQVPKQQNPWNSPDSLRNFKGDNREQLKKQFQEYFERKKVENQLLADKQGNIVRLPQDHMPCLVPDGTTAPLMPNAWGAVTSPFRPRYHPIPNPALPKKPSADEEKRDESK